MSYLDLDFKTPKQRRMNANSGQPPSFIRLLLKLIGIIFICIIAFLLWSSRDTPEKMPLAKTEAITLKPSLPQETLPQEIFSVELPPQVKPLQIDITAEEAPAPVFLTKSAIIKQGDSLSSVFNKQGVNASVLYKIMTDAKDSKLLKTIRSGQTFDFVFDDSKTLTQLSYHPDITTTYHFTKATNGEFVSSVETNPLESIPVYKEGTIDSSLFLAAAKNDIPVNIIMNMVGIFGWDIDFSLDIRKGDQFKLIYNELYQDGVRIKTGQVLAAEFVNKKKTFQAVLYTDPKGKSNYYSPNGKSMRKAFLRNPVKFSRISSRFTKNRWHPVLSKWRSHKGVDYAASRGTPIFAAGDGRIVHAGNKGGYGRAVIIQHGGKYTTLYAHMNAYNKNTRKGKRVKQGQIIGYVGSSGMVTGPHLHYEFRVSGVHRNPLTVKLPAAQPINKKYKDDFNQTKTKLLNMLKVMGASG